jgi:hypothetical protein
MLVFEPQLLRRACLDNRYHRAINGVRKWFRVVFSARWTVKNDERLAY